MADSKIGAKIRAMLDLADSEEQLGHYDTAANHRATAEKWMAKYRIEQEEAIAADPGVAKPVQVEMDLVGHGSPYRGHYAAIWHWVARHCGVQQFCKYVYTEHGYLLKAYAVGYQEDLSYAEMLFTSARMVFMERLEPKVLVGESDQINAYRLRSAGIERIRIAEMLWGSTDKLFLSRVGRLYKAECKERGEEPLLSGRGVTGAAYRDQYAEQFVTTLQGRLWQARQAAGEGGGMVLHGRAERIKEAFYTFFPEQRPKPELPYVDPRKECPKCQKATSGACREHPYPPMGRGSAGPNYNTVAAERGRLAGRAAARVVDLGRGGGRQGIGN